MEELNKSQIVLLLILVSIVVSFTTAIVTAALFEQSPSSVTQTIQRVVERSVGNEGDEEDSGELRVITEEERFIEVVKNVSPAIASVVATKDLPVLEQCYVSPFGDDEFFNRFFPDFRVPQLCERGTETRQVSSGSGFFVRSDGLLVTNKHVVADREASYTVITNDGKRISAKVLVRDPLQDLALLDVEGEGYKELVLGDSDSLQVGQRVIAIGNALGEFQNTVSVGVISGLSRNVIASGEELRSLIQTDAAINPGNSGGPLLNLSGEVIGVNTAVAQGAENIGFALASNLVKDDIKDLEKFGKIVYPFLGVRYRTITPDFQQERDLPVSEGAYLTGGGGGSAITPGSPAEKAGLKEGDIIIEISGKAITRRNILADVLSRHDVGDKVKIKYLRDGKEAELEATLVERTL